MANIIDTIISKTGIKREELMQKVKEKQKELSDLVSEEGAAYIVAKELGLDLVQRADKKLVIKNIVPGMRNFDINARVIRVFEPREYERKGKKFKVGSIIMADASGGTRMSLWDEQTGLMAKLKAGDAVEIRGCYAKTNGRNELELRLGRRGSIGVLANSGLPPAEELKLRAGTEAGIADFAAGGFFDVRAAIVQLFETEQYYEICPSCGMRIKAENGAYSCPTHGKIQPSLAMVLSGVIDDGTGNIRTVFFRENATKLLGMSMEEVLERKGRVFEKVDVLGKEFVFRGRVRKNQMFDRLEFIVSDIRDVDAKSEATKIINALTANS